MSVFRNVREGIVFDPPARRSSVGNLSMESAGALKLLNALSTVPLRASRSCLLRACRDEFLDVVSLEMRLGDQIIEIILRDACARHPPVESQQTRVDSRFRARQLVLHEVRPLVVDLRVVRGEVDVAPGGIGRIAFGGTSATPVHPAEHVHLVFDRFEWFQLSSPAVDGHLVGNVAPGTSNGAHRIPVERVRRENDGFSRDEVPDVVGPRRVVGASDGREGESHLVVDPVS